MEFISVRVHIYNKVYKRQRQYGGGLLEQSLNNTKRWRKKKKAFFYVTIFIRMMEVYRDTVTDGSVLVSAVEM